MKKPCGVEPIVDRLVAFYGHVSRRKDRDPLVTLIGTILSQNTTDKQSDAALDNLLQKFPRLADLATAKPASIKSCIKSAGLADAKAKTIVTVIRRLLKERDDADLSFLSGMTAKEARDWLTSNPGVGEKTAACVILFGLGMNAFPVDTHIRRVLIRLGIAAEGSSPDRIMKEVEPLIPPGKKLDAHVLLIRLGREICGARIPLCDACPIRDCCYFL